MSKVGGIVFFGKLVGEGEGIVSVFSLCFNVIFDVPDIFTSPKPGISFALTSHCYLHPVFKRGVFLEEIQNMESNLSFDETIANSEEKPLSATRCIHVLLKKEVVLFI